MRVLPTRDVADSRASAVAGDGGAPGRSGPSGACNADAAQFLGRPRCRWDLLSQMAGNGVLAQAKPGFRVAGLAHRRSFPAQADGAILRPHRWDAASTRADGGLVVSLESSGLAGVAGSSTLRGTRDIGRYLQPFHGGVAGVVSCSVDLRPRSARAVGPHLIERRIAAHEDRVLRRPAGLA